jgi:hypothetical protein
MSYRRQISKTELIVTLLSLLLIVYIHVYLV